MSIPAATRFKQTAGPKAVSRFSNFPWKPFSLAIVPGALLAWYLAWVAPNLVPVPLEVKVPYPALTRVLEDAAVWCGRHRIETVLVACGVLAMGLVSRFSVARNYTILAVTLWVALGLSYLSLSAPIDRLMKAVEDQIPRDGRIPSSRSEP